MGTVSISKKDMKAMSKPAAKPAEAPKKSTADRKAANREANEARHLENSLRVAEIGLPTEYTERTITVIRKHGKKTIIESKQVTRKKRPSKQLRSFDRAKAGLGHNYEVLQAEGKQAPTKAEKADELAKNLDAAIKRHPAGKGRKKTSAPEEIIVSDDVTPYEGH